MTCVMMRLWLDVFVTFCTSWVSVQIDWHYNVELLVQLTTAVGTVRIVRPAVDYERYFSQETDSRTEGLYVYCSIIEQCLLWLVELCICRYVNRWVGMVELRLFEWQTQCPVADEWVIMLMTALLGEWLENALTHWCAVQNPLTHSGSLAGWNSRQNDAFWHVKSHFRNDQDLTTLLVNVIVLTSSLLLYKIFQSYCCDTNPTLSSPVPCGLWSIVE